MMNLNRLFNQIKQQFPQIEQLYADSAIFLAPHIPMNKFLGAKEYLPAHTQIDEILVLVDDTVFGQSNHGLCLTKQGIYCKEILAEIHFYAMHAITSIDYSKGWINQHLVINHSNKITLTQPSQSGARLLAEFLQQYCKAQNSETGSSTQQHTKQGQHSNLNLQPIIKLYAYLLLGWRGEWDDQARSIMWAGFSLDFVNPRDKAFLVRFMQQNQHLDFLDILNEVREVQDGLPDALRYELLVAMMLLMEKKGFNGAMARNHFEQIVDALNIDEETVLDLLDQFPIFTYEQDQTRQRDPTHTTSSLLNQTQQAACQLLDIVPEKLNAETLKTAYRLKIAEFHPDQYQQLPPAVRQLIEQQAQQLNQARSCLQAYLASISAK